MSPEELQTWVVAHIDDIYAFMDYEATLSSEEDFSHNLREYWFSRANWNEAGYRFLHLGHDASGGDFAVWIRPGEAGPHPIVQFGSEGAAGVVASSPQRWAQLVSHAPDILDDDGRVGVHDLGGPLSDEDKDWVEAACLAQGRYQLACESRFGPMPSFADLTGDLEMQDSEFCAWAAKVRQVAREDSV